MPITVAILCGGPSLERGISLNSARSVLDHLGGDVQIVPFYLDMLKNAYRISIAQLYSNTPSDFDFKLARTARPLSRDELIQDLQETDLVFPLIHGAYGEGGELQTLLEEHGIPFLGSSSRACRKAFDKFSANENLKQLGYFTYPQLLVEEGQPGRDIEERLRDFFEDQGLVRAVVKPASGGSSICVSSVSTPEEALDWICQIFDRGIDHRVVVEPFVRGREFTCIVLQDRDHRPVALLPTEIETDYGGHELFDYRKKYLPTSQVVHHCPPRFRAADIEAVRTQSEELFSLFGMRDFARFDGWLDSRDRIWFSDFNPISGMEQNSFLFQQSARVGLSHRALLKCILSSACRRYAIPLPPDPGHNPSEARKPVHVLFGGSTSERQVSLMSGTNAWLKLRRSSRYAPRPFLLDLEHNVWELPYGLTLYHTVEEIMDNCAQADQEAGAMNGLASDIKYRLTTASPANSDDFFIPRKMSLETFLDSSPFVFIGLHGGIGENGSLQAMLEQRSIPFNGPGQTPSRVAMDKWETGRIVDQLDIDGVCSVPKRLVAMGPLTREGPGAAEEIFEETREQLRCETLLVKPRADGCSSGIIRLFGPRDFRVYLEMLASRATFIPKNTFAGQKDNVEMPLQEVEELLLETFITTDRIRVADHSLEYERVSGWIEITAGVLDQGGLLQVFNPSLTVSEGDVLSVEEKFQGGTGINITPPPEEIVGPKALDRCKELLRQVARAFSISGYARLDAFLEVDTGRVMLIEVNTLPALTPSTVLFQQALSCEPPIYPRELIEAIIANKDY